MTEILASLVPLSAVPGMLPGRPCLATIRGWYTRGIRGQRLPIVMVGGRIFVDPVQLLRFFAAIPGPGNAAEIPETDELLSESEAPCR